MLNLVTIMVLNHGPDRTELYNWTGLTGNQSSIWFFIPKNL